MSVSDLVDLTRELIEIPSVTGEEKEIALWLDKRFQNLPGDWRWAREGNSVWVASPASPQKPLIAFFGHTDTVPPSASNPVRVENEELFGLGAADMKGGLAVMLALIEELVEQPSAANALFVFYDCEEGPVANNGLKPLLENHPEWKSIDLAVCLEPTDNAIQLGCVGGIHAKIIFEGQAAHSARPWQGDNAVHKAGDFLVDLKNREAVVVDYEGLTFREVMSITLAQGGTARNVVPGTFEMNLNYRYAPGKDEDEARQDIEKMVAGRAHIEWIEQIPSGKVCLNNPLLMSLKKKRELNLEAKQAWTDVAQLSQFGLDALNCGPGHPKYAHQADERVRLSALTDSLNIMKDLLSCS